MKRLFFILPLLFTINTYSQWSNLSSTLQGPAAIRQLTIFDNKLIASGTFTFSGNSAIKNIGVWNDTAWSALGNGIADIWVTTCVVNNELYAATDASISKWNGTSWDQMTNPGLSHVRAIISYNNELYAGGYVTNGSGRIAKWNGLAWVIIYTGAFGTSSVDNFYVFNNRLYAIGQFNDISGNSYYLGESDGTGLSPFGPQIQFGGGVGQTAINFDNDWYIGGNFGLGKWDGTNWTHITQMNQGEALFSYNTRLFAGGGYDTQHYAYAFDGGAWTDISYNLDKGVRSFAVFGNELYCAGFFSNPSYIAKSPLNINIPETNEEYLFDIYPNPASSFFTILPIKFLTQHFFQIYNSFNDCLNL